MKKKTKITLPKPGPGTTMTKGGGGINVDAEQQRREDIIAAILDGDSEGIAALKEAIIEVVKTHYPIAVINDMMTQPEPPDPLMINAAGSTCVHISSW